MKVWRTHECPETSKKHFQGWRLDLKTFILLQPQRRPSAGLCSGWGFTCTKLCCSWGSVCTHTHRSLVNTKLGKIPSLGLCLSFHAVGEQSIQKFPVAGWLGGVMGEPEDALTPAELCLQIGTRQIFSLKSDSKHTIKKTNLGWCFLSEQESVQSCWLQA